MKSVTVKGQVRNTLGKKDAKKLRAQGIVPGVLYGEDKAIHLAVPFSELRHVVYTPEVFLIDLDLDGETHRAKIQDVQWHPVEEQMLHIDFLKIEEEKPIKIGVPVKIAGLAKGIKAGGKLKVNMRKLRIKALADHVPDFIEVDVTRLGIGDSIKVDEMKRDNLEFLDNKSNLIVAVVSTRVAQSAMLLPEDLEEAEAEEAEETTEATGQEESES